MPLTSEILSEVGLTPTQRAKWLLRFYGETPSKWDNHKRHEWRSKWRLFLRGAVPLTNDLDLPVYPLIKAWWMELHRGMQLLARGEQWVVPVAARIEWEIKSGSLSAQVQCTRDEESVWAKVSETLLAAGKAFQFCKRCSCRKPFIATKRQQYCSKRCQGTASKQRYRQRLRT